MCMLSTASCIYFCFASLCPIAAHAAVASIAVIVTFFFIKKILIRFKYVV